MSGKNVTVSLAGSILKFIIFIAIIVFVFRLATTAYDFGYRVFTEEPMSNPPGVEISVAITDDMSTMDIGKMLENQGLIRDAKLFFIQEKVSEYKDKIVPGTYTLNTSMTAEEMLAVIGGTVEETTEENIGDSQTLTDPTEEGGAPEAESEELITEESAEE